MTDIYSRLGVTPVINGIGNKTTPRRLDTQLLGPSRPWTTPTTTTVPCPSLWTARESGSPSSSAWRRRSSRQAAPPPSFMPPQG